MNHYNRPISLDEQRLYDHLLRLSQVELPNQLIERFRLLFIEGAGYPEPEMQVVVEQIAAAKCADLEFKFILNRCCHILINRWQIHPRLQGAIADLVATFDQPSSNPPYSRANKRLREMVMQFIQTDQYLTLRRLANVLRQNAEVTTQNQPLVSYIWRYPYLYKHCLLAEDSSSDERKTVRRMQAQAQHQFEVDLSQYVTHRIIRSQVEPTIIVPSTKNPTLLCDRDLHTALKQFAGKVDGRNTQRDLAQQFLTYSHQTKSYQTFKDDLYTYLTAAVEPEYGKHQFYDRLYAHLRETLAQSDHSAPDDFLLLRTCSKLLDFLIVDNPRKTNHVVFLDLITNLGTTLAVNLLLKIVLLCQKIKPHLEKRFSILFNHYETRTRDSGIDWLIETLENLNVAFATNFGSVNFLSL
jgi:hypothetical protein